MCASSCFWNPAGDFWTQGYINADLGGVSKLTYSYKRNYKESQRK